MPTSSHIAYMHAYTLICPLKCHLCNIYIDRPYPLIESQKSEGGFVFLLTQVCQNEFTGEAQQQYDKMTKTPRLVAADTTRHNPKITHLLSVGAGAVSCSWCHSFLQRLLCCCNNN